MPLINRATGPYSCLRTVHCLKRWGIFALDSIFSLSTNIRVGSMVSPSWGTFLQTFYWKCDFQAGVLFRSPHSLLVLEGSIASQVSESTDLPAREMPYQVQEFALLVFYNFLHWILPSIVFVPSDKSSYMCSFPFGRSTCVSSSISF